jgi:hypothetical protein
MRCGRALTPDEPIGGRWKQTPVAMTRERVPGFHALYRLRPCLGQLLLVEKAAYLISW